MHVIGKNWPSTQTMQDLVSHLETDLVLAWGYPVEGAFGGKPRIDGLEQLTKFKDAGVPCPDFTTDPNEVITWIREGHIVLGRKRNHSQGRDVVRVNEVLHSNRWVGLSEYWVKAVQNVVDEWRIHVLNGWYIGQGRKINTANDTSLVPIRSRKRGWKICHQTMPPQFIKDTAKQAVRSLGYDFGAVDVLQTANDGVSVLEVNKAPGLDNYTAARYARAIERLVNERNDRGD